MIELLTKSNHGDSMIATRILQENIELGEGQESRSFDPNGDIPRSGTLVYRVQGKIVGVLSFCPTNSNPTFLYYGHDIAVIGEYRGIGIGRLLIADYIQRVRRNIWDYGSKKSFFTLIADTNIPSIKLHEVCGFEKYVTNLKQAPNGLSLYLLE